eukprot:jgi/Botrbrau1/17427/Bobra.0054s0021.1
MYDCLPCGCTWPFDDVGCVCPKQHRRNSCCCCQEVVPIFAEQSGTVLLCHMRSACISCAPNMAFAVGSLRQLLEEVSASKPACRQYRLSCYTR